MSTGEDFVKKYARPSLITEEPGHLAGQIALGLMALAFVALELYLIFFA